MTLAVCHLTALFVREWVRIKANCGKLLPIQVERSGFHLAVLRWGPGGCSVCPEWVAQLLDHCWQGMVECEVEYGGLAQGGREPGMVAQACNLSIMRLIFPYGLTREPENSIVSNVWEQLTQTGPR